MLRVETFRRISLYMVAPLAVGVLAASYGFAPELSRFATDMIAPAALGAVIAFALFFALPAARRSDLIRIALLLPPMAWLAQCAWHGHASLATLAGTELGMVGAHFCSHCEQIRSLMRNSPNAQLTPNALGTARRRPTSIALRPQNTER